MAGAQLGTALRQIQRLFSEGSSTGLSDTQLLSRFANQRDEAAFAAILARHGPMVLAVCRGVLRDAADAEDAFQATFLVLARKAGSAWAEGQLGGWLHKVAYRIAVRASADAARRRDCERRAAEAAVSVEYTQGQLDHDLRPALHDELARLPSKFRLPVVLCYLEGLTHAQAADQLQCAEATLRRRLAEARERLRARLTTRGFAPSDSALGLALAREAGAAVPPLCLEATIRAAMGIAAGEAMAAVVGARVASLTRGRLAMITTGWKTTAAFVISVAAVACLAVGIGARGGKIAATTPQEGKSPVMAPASRPADALVDQKARSSRKHAIQGLVLSPDGKPVSSATVYWLGFPRFEQRRMRMPRGYKEKAENRQKMLALGTTKVDGRFDLVGDFDGEGYPGRMVIVKAAGAGISGRTFLSETVKEGSGEDESLTFKLRRTTTIEGRLLTPSGAPAVGAKVLLEDLRDTDNELEGDWVSSGNIRGVDEPRFDFWPSSWTTDKNGRFRIEGIVPELTFARIHFRHPDFADDDVFVSTGLPLTGWLREFDVQPVDAKFTHTLEPARPVAGVVTDKETGKPLAGVLVEMVPIRTRNRYGGNYPISARTDASGHYRAAGAAGDSYMVAAYPDPASGYLSVQKERTEWPAGAKVLEIDLAVPRSQGSILRGRVVEAGSGRPVAGASVIYQPEPGNPHNHDEYEFENPVLTDGEGNFALTVLPGAGLLAVEAPTPDFVRFALSSNRSSIARPHGFVRLNLSEGKDQDNPPVQITIRKGVRLEARLVGPDGLLVEGLVMGWCAEINASQLDNWTSPLAYTEGLFRLEGVDPERNYRGFFVESKRRLGAVVELKYDPKGPVEIRLQPAATAKGVVVDHKGRPAKGTQILPWMALTKEDREFTQDDFDDEGKLAIYTLFTLEPLLTTYPAEFCYDKLIPGVRYYVGAGETHHPIPVLKPGEVLDLGKIVMKQPEGE